MTARVSTRLVCLLAVVLAAVLGTAAWAWHAAQDDLLKLRTELRATQARASQAEAALAETERLRAAGDALTHRLAAAEAARATAYKERDDAILRATTGRPCLRGDALRVLDGAPGLSLAHLPGAAGSAAAAHAAAAADPAAAGAGAGAPGAAERGADTGADTSATVTDTGAARWMLAAGQQYEACRARLDALIDFERQRAARVPPAAAGPLNERAP